MKSPILAPKTLILTAVAAVALIAGTTPAAHAGDGATDGAPRPRARAVDRLGRRGQLRQRLGRIHRFRKMRMEAARALGFTAEQQRAALEKARAAQPIVAEARRELARLRVQAESAATTPGTGEAGDRQARRKAGRDAVRDLRHRTAERLAPLAKDVLATLTPEQRAKLEGMAAARGRKFDETKFAQRVGRWLARPMTAEMLEARLGTR